MTWNPRRSDASLSFPIWRFEEFARLGAVMASDSEERGLELAYALKDGLADHLESDVLIRVVGKFVLDDPTVTESVCDLDLFGQLVIEALADLPKSVQYRLNGLWGFEALLEDAEAGHTFGLTHHMARLNAPATAHAMVQRDLLRYPSTDGGAAGVIAALAQLAGGPTYIEQQIDGLVFDAASDEPTTDGILWASYLETADLYGLAEKIGAEAIACASGTARIRTFNARASLLLDRAEALHDNSATAFAQYLVCQAWLTHPDHYTRNVQRRITHMTGDVVDLQILTMMDHSLGFGGTHE